MQRVNRTHYALVSIHAEGSTKSDEPGAKLVSEEVVLEGFVHTITALDALYKGITINATPLTEDQAGKAMVQMLDDFAAAT